LTLCCTSVPAPRIDIYKALELLNLPITQVKVVTLSNQSWSHKLDTMIDKIALQYIKMGENAVDLLYESIQNPAFSESKKININAQLENEPIFFASDRISENRKKDPLKVLMLESSAASATQSLLCEFEKTSGIKIEIETTPFNLLYNSILNGFEKDSFDICEVDVPWISSLVDQNVLTNLDQCDSNFREYMGNIIEEIIPEYTTFNGSTYTYPYMFCSQLLFYRKDLFEDLTIKRLFLGEYKAELRPPKTWNEFNAVAKFFTREYNPESATEYGTTLGAKLYNGAVCEYLPRLWYYGGSVVKNGEVCIDNEEAIRALNNYKESYRYASPSSPDRWWEEQAEEFSQGQTAMMILFNAHATDIVNLSKSKVVGKVGFDVIPGNISLVGGWSLGISTKSQRKQDAIKFLEWICSEKISIENTILGGCSPCKRVYDDAEIALIYPWHRTMVDVYKYAQSRTLPANKNGDIVSFFQFEKILGTAVHNTVCGNTSAKEALTKAAAQLRELYKNKT
jgi:multiple sugar transport system substrate-binding protein